MIRENGRRKRFSRRRQHRSFRERFEPAWKRFRASSNVFKPREDPRCDWDVGSFVSSSLLTNCTYHLQNPYFFNVVKLILIYIYMAAFRKNTLISCDWGLLGGAFIYWNLRGTTVPFFNLRKIV